MPRNVKESDDEVETRGGRRTRSGLNPSVTDSPLRRSSRIKQPLAYQDNSSPESVSDVSSISGAKSTRRRTTTGETGARVRRNSVASDISELTETESLADGMPKRITRRSVAGIPSVETPTKMNGRLRRATRAGSETKSTPPVARSTRRTRASSMEPEIGEEPNLRDVGTPMKGRKRASVMPSEPAVAEESDDGKTEKAGKTTEETVEELDENESDALTQNISTSMRRKSKVETKESDEIMEVDASPVRATESNPIELSAQEATETAADISGVSRNLEDPIVMDTSTETESVEKTKLLQKTPSPAKGSAYKIENLLSTSSEKEEKSPGNKENEVDNDVKILTRKSFNSSSSKIASKRGSLSNDDKSSKTPTISQEIADCVAQPSEAGVRKEHLVEKCVVVIEPMILSQTEKAVPVQLSFKSEHQKTDDTTEHKSNVSPSSTQNHPNPEETSEKVDANRKEDPANCEGIDGKIDDNSELKIINIRSIPDMEEKSLQESKATAEKEAETFKISDSIEIIDLDSDVPQYEETSPRHVERNEETCGNELTIPAQTTDPLSAVAEKTAEKTDSPSPAAEKPAEKTDPPSSAAEKPAEKTDPPSSAAEKPAEKTDLPSAAAEKPAEKTDPPSSITHEKSEDIEDNVVFDLVKGKSSIVTESPVSGANVEDDSGLIEERDNDKSVSSEKKVTERKSMANDDESDCNGYPAFKDIPADEWKGIDAEKAKKRDEDDRVSLCSASTDRNESECELQLVDKEAFSSVDKYLENKRAEKSDYDTDETLIMPEILEGSTKKKNKDEEMQVVVEETPMDLSSDGEVGGKSPSELPKEFWKKRASLATPRKSIGSNRSSLNKKDTAIGNTSLKESTTPSNASRRKSLANTEVDPVTPKRSDDNANTSITSSRSSSKSPKKRVSTSAPSKNDDSDESEADDENSESKTAEKSLTISRKSLEASAKKIESSQTSVSAKNTPAKIDGKTSGSPVKRRPSNKFVLDRSGDDSSDSDNAEDQQKLQKNLESGLKQSGVDGAEACEEVVVPATSKKEEKRRSSLSKRYNDSEASRGNPAVTKEKLNKSAKIGSAKKILANRNSQPKATEVSSESENDYANSSAKDDASSKSEKNNSYVMQLDSDSIDEDEKLNKSSNTGSAEKSPRNLNLSKVTPETLDSEIDADDSKNASIRSNVDLREKLNKSAKLSAKKNPGLKDRSALLDSESELEMDADDSKNASIKSNVDLREKLNKSAKLSAKKNPGVKDRSALLDSESELERDVDDSKETTISSEADSAEKIKKAAKPRKTTTVSMGGKLSVIELDSSIEDDEDEGPQDADKSRLGSSKRLLIDADKNYSTIAQVNSDSESMVTSESDDEANATSLIPQFIFDQDTTSSSSVEDEESSDTIDSDVAKDMNLHGRSTIEYSDDDVPADDCLATESESSDSDDDGADLMDFVVEDDDEDEDDSFEDVLIDLGERDSPESSATETKKPRRRIIPRPAGDSDSVDSEEETASPTKNVSVNLNKSANAKTPKRNENLNKTHDLVEPGTPLANLNTSLKLASRKMKDLLIKNCSSPKVRESLSKVSTPRVGTPLSKSLREADSPTKLGAADSPLTKRLSKSVRETVETPTKLGAADASLTKRLSKSVRETVETPTKLGAADSSLTKRLSKSVLETVDTPTKLSSSFKEKSPKFAMPQQLDSGLAAGTTKSVTKSHLTKVQSTKFPEHRQSMLTPNSESPETRFLMKEKLNESLPALKLQQKSKASRRSSVDKLRDEIAKMNGNAAAVEDETNNVDADNGDQKKKKRKSKSGRDADTSMNANEESFARSEGTENTSNANETTDTAEADVSLKKSKKEKKKQKLADTPESAIPTTEQTSKIERKKKNEENAQDIRINGTDKKDKKKKREETLVEPETVKLTKKDKKKKQQTESLDESEINESKKNKKKKQQTELLDESEINETKKTKKKKQIGVVDGIEAINVSKKTKKRKSEEISGVVEEKNSKKQSQLSSKNLAADSEGEPEAIKSSIKAGHDAKKKKHQAKNQSETSNAVGTSKSNLKRLPDDILEILSETVERPNKRRKVAKAEKIVPSRSMVGSRHQPPSSPVTNDGYVPLSGSGGTTLFEVAIMSKTKKSKKAVAAASFRERMLARNPRQPISAYLMYQQKQKASCKDRPY